MNNQWTDEQLLAVSSREGNLLVAAAAGAGKTSVLVERIIRRVTDPDAILPILAVQAEVWNEDYTSLGERLARDLRENPANLSVFAA